MKNWESILIKKGNSILKALELLNISGTQFLVVVDDHMHLVGAVTDGDIRRGLLKGIQIQDKVDLIMNLNPVKEASTVNKAKLKKTMRSRDIKYIPLVDESNRVTGVISLDELAKVEKRDNHVILMAGGLGSRLETLTADRPKGMLEIGGRPILETIIEMLKEHGFSKFIISVNYKSEVIEKYFKDGKDWNVEISYIKEKTRLGTAGALSMYQPNGLPFIVMNGDLLTKISFSDLVDFHIKNKNTATMCLRQYEHQIPFGVINTDNERVVSIEEKPVRRYFVNAGIYVLNPESLSEIPQDTFYDMPTHLDRLIQKESKVGAYPFYEYWIDIGRLDDYERAHAEFLEVFKS